MDAPECRRGAAAAYAHWSGERTVSGPGSLILKGTGGLPFCAGVRPGGLLRKRQHAAVSHPALFPHGRAGTLYRARAADGASAGRICADVCGAGPRLCAGRRRDYGARRAVRRGIYAGGNISSQFISGLLFALPLLSGASVIRITPPFESRSYVDLTLRALADFGVRAAFTDENTIAVPGGQTYRPCAYTVEGDYSQAAFLAVLGAARGGVAVTGLREDSLQGDRAILDILARCGARIIRTDDAALFEKSDLRGTEIDLADCPDLGPVPMVLGALCKGETVIRNAARLRMKESDRIAAMEQELRKMGAELFSTQDTVTVRGGALHGADGLYGHNDHRVVMALAVAAYAAGVPAAIGGAEAVNKSWPDFFETVRALGGKVELTDE
ncbi:MAG: 3-phosphoshikimate 1-carboxyvinyltransferase [Ruthenibacterium lactatiformans]